MEEEYPGYAKTRYGGPVEGDEEEEEEIVEKKAEELLPKSTGHFPKLEKKREELIEKREKQKEKYELKSEKKKLEREIRMMKYEPIYKAGAKAKEIGEGLGEDVVNIAKKYRGTPEERLERKERTTRKIKKIASAIGGASSSMSKGSSFSSYAGIGGHEREEMEDMIPEGESLRSPEEVLSSRRDMTVQREYMEEEPTMEQRRPVQKAPLIDIGFGAGSKEKFELGLGGKGELLDLGFGQKQKTVDLGLGLGDSGRDIDLGFSSLKKNGKGTVAKKESFIDFIGIGKDPSAEIFGSRQQQAKPVRKKKKTKKRRRR